MGLGGVFRPFIIGYCDHALACWCWCWCCCSYTESPWIQLRHVGRLAFSCLCWHAFHRMACCAQFTVRPIAVPCTQMNARRVLGRQSMSTCASQVPPACWSLCRWGCSTDACLPQGQCLCFGWGVGEQQPSTVWSVTNACSIVEWLVAAGFGVKV